MYTMYNCDCCNFMCMQEIKNGNDGVHMHTKIMVVMVCFFMVISGSGEKKGQ